MIVLRFLADDADWEIEAKVRPAGQMTPTFGGTSCATKPGEERNHWSDNDDRLPGETFRRSAELSARVEATLRRSHEALAAGDEVLQRARLAITQAQKLCGDPGRESRTDDDESDESS